MILPYEIPVNGARPAVRVDGSGLSVGEARYAWRDLPYICRLNFGEEGDELEMRSPQGTEIRIVVIRHHDAEELQEEILLRLIGVARDQIPRRDEEVEILAEDGAVVALGRVVSRHLDYAYIDLPGEGLGGYRLDRVRRLNEST